MHFISSFAILGHQQTLLNKELYNFQRLYLYRASLFVKHTIKLEWKYLKNRLQFVDCFCVLKNIENITLCHRK